ncbi:bifunctional oligoribonuclease/PAP phosphatase NrnA, partial [Bacillus licheniformis]|uniref:DHH family phosphoesterase n=1 Tax=Bacillus licheniformis TaxID=1402 RepID=UPI000FA4E444
MNKFEEVIREIERHHQIGVISHVNPDGDNIGSVLSLVHALKSLGKDAFPILTDKVPSNMMFLKGVESFREVDSPPELLIVVDCSDEERLGLKSDFPSRAQVSINID